jgi:short subunit dehydrogenase-like uncharacterized protein
MLEILLYGANGFTGELIAREAVRRGIRPILAGRNEAALSSLAGELGVQHRIFGLDDSTAIERELKDVAVVLNCAGPFAHTARPLADACLRARVHYLDITGEAAVFEDMARRDAAARAAGVMILPGAGFDVVPTDCLAVHLKRRLPSATRLALGFQVATRMSKGTTLTVIENLGDGGLARKGGHLQKVPAAWKTRIIDFGEGPTKAITIPWGDVVTAHHSTGIRDIEVYMGAPFATRAAVKSSRYLGWLFGSRAMKNWLAKRARSGPPGPSASERNQGRSLVWGEVIDDKGGRAVSRLRGPESYNLTVAAALAVVGRILNGEAPHGFQTPALAYGPDFVLSLPGLTRTDEPQS